MSIAVLLGANKSVAETDMANVLRFEMQLANVTIPQEKRHDTGAMYNKMSVRQLQQYVPEVSYSTI